MVIINDYEVPIAWKTFKRGDKILFFYVDYSLHCRCNKCGFEYTTHYEAETELCMDCMCKRYDDEKAKALAHKKAMCVVQ